MSVSRTILARFVRHRPGLIPGALIAAAVMTSSFATETVPVTSDLVAKEISKAFHYVPEIDGDKPGEEAAAAVTTDTLTLDKFVVTRYNDSHKLELLLTEQAKRIREESFSWKEGGTIFKKNGKNVTTERKLKFNSTHKGWDMINFAW